VVRRARLDVLLQERRPVALPVLPPVEDRERRLVALARARLVGLRGLGQRVGGFQGPGTCKQGLVGRRVVREAHA